MVKSKMHGAGHYSGDWLLRPSPDSRTGAAYDSAAGKQLARVGAAARQRRGLTSFMLSAGHTGDLSSRGTTCPLMTIPPRRRPRP
ncbi:hypothetical protein FRACA_260011 [Frankia canadensis]|uniref:Uncharacterized protein n=1 Tax=Frankia canadensis TaxID=1836972 RepID=A0A2I2KSA8_9ACTN|nr:hypothetical protein FRACA_260011 [Frankia canadensis]SOU55848.1 hypothetical protein FRACA_260011 [Frankia canadensis]